jgi:NitT/TauT family transport system substrate-binding protein
MKLRSLAALVALGVVSATGVARAEEITINIALVRSISNGAELIALDRGYFKEYGLNVVIEDIKTSAKTIAMLAPNRLQIIAGGISAGYFNALQKDLPIAIIGDRGRRRSPQPDAAPRPRGRDQGSSSSRAGPSRATGRLGPTYELGKPLETGGPTLSDVDVKVLRFPQMGAALPTGDRRRAAIPPFTTSSSTSIWRSSRRARQAGEAEPDDDRRHHGEHRLAKEHRDALQGVTAYLRGVRDYCNAYHHGSIRNEMIDSIVRHGSERNPKLLNDYPWVARSPNLRLNVASMLDMQDWYIANKFSTAKLPAERLVDMSYADAAVKKLGPFVLENKESKLEGCR